MKSIETYFEEYSEFHKNPTNQTMHVIGIPLIMFSLLGLLRHMSYPVGNFVVDAGLVLWIFATLWYLKLHVKLALFFSPVAFGMYFLSAFTPLSYLWSIFILGWVVQLWGHKHFEKNSPAFLQNLEHVLIGPLWIFVKVFKISYQK